MVVKNLGVSLQPEILEKLDAMRGDIPRSKFLSRLVEKALKEER